MLTILKEIYLQTRCLVGPLSVSNKGTLDIDWKNNEHVQSKAIIYAGSHALASNVLNLPITVYMLI